MTVIRFDDSGVARIRATLDGGDAAVVPLDVPLPYIVAARSAAVTNRAKGRPEGQPVGLMVADLDVVLPYLELEPEGLDAARRFASELRLNLFLPVGAVPEELTPSVSDGLLGVTTACPARLRPLLSSSGLLFVSSANRTGGETTTSAAAADEAFGGALPVLDDPERDPAVPCGSSAIVRVYPDGEPELVRHGIQSAELGADGLAERLRVLRAG